MINVGDVVRHVRTKEIGRVIKINNGIVVCETFCKTGFYLWGVFTKVSKFICREENLENYIIIENDIKSSLPSC